MSSCLGPVQPSVFQGKTSVAHFTIGKQSEFAGRSEVAALQPTDLRTLGTGLSGRPPQPVLQTLGHRIVCRTYDEQQKAENDRVVEKGGKSAPDYEKQLDVLDI